MAVIQPRPTHILYQCAKCGDDQTSFNVICDGCDFLTIQWRYLKNWTDNFFQMFFMGTPASREMTSRKLWKFSILMGWTLPSTDMWRGEVFAISDCLVLYLVLLYHRTKCSVILWFFASPPRPPPPRPPPPRPPPPRPPPPRPPRRREHSNSKSIQPISFKFYMRVDTPLRFFVIEIWYPPRTRTTAFAAKRHLYPPNLQTAISP